MSMVQEPRTTDVRDAFADFVKRRVPTTNPADLQRLSVTLYRLLGRGAPVTPARLGAACALPRERVERLLRDVPPLTLDDRGSVIAFGGLSLAPTRHQFSVDQSKLYTWCVLDALFLPEILRKPAVLVTSCPGSGLELSVELAPREVRAARPPGCVVSIVTPDTKACRDDLRTAFCDHVNLFKDEQTFETWKSGRRDVGCLPLHEAQLFARQRNALRYPDVDLDA
jgi:alkylmercury lyase